MRAGSLHAVTVMSYQESPYGFPAPVNASMMCSWYQSAYSSES